MNDHERLIEALVKNSRLEAALNLLRQMADDDKRRRGMSEAMLTEMELNDVLLVAGMPEIEKDPTTAK